MHPRLIWLLNTKVLLKFIRVNGEVKQCFLTVKGRHLVIINSSSEQHYPLSEPLSFTSSSGYRDGLWDDKASLGIDINIGNVNQLGYSVNTRVQRRTPSA